MNLQVHLSGIFGWNQWFPVRFDGWTSYDLSCSLHPYSSHQNDETCLFIGDWKKILVSKTDSCDVCPKCRISHVWKCEVTSSSSPHPIPCDARATGAHETHPVWICFGTVVETLGRWFQVFFTGILPMFRTWNVKLKRDFYVQILPDFMFMVHMSLKTCISAHTCGKRKW